MEKKLNFIVLAALLHDIGKLLERGRLEEFSHAPGDTTYLNRCPMDKGRPGYIHSSWTAAFCDWLEPLFTCIRIADNDWKIWSAAHHRNDELGLETTVIRTADRLSASEREPGHYYQHQIHLKTLLEPVTERISIGNNKNNRATFYRYPLCVSGREQENCFPRKGESFAEQGIDLQIMSEPEQAVKPESWRHLVSKDPLIAQYEQLGRGLLNDISALAQKQPDLPMAALLDSLIFLLEKYTANVPSATNLRHPDISLFDHLRTTAAIAQALYIQQMSQEKPGLGVGNREEMKWLLVCGDFSGIQKFIYRLTNKGAAKGLRGRSFYVDQFTRLCAGYLLRRLQMTRAAAIYNAGGKFYLLLPAVLEKKMFKARQEINRWLLEHFQGEVFLGIGKSPVNGEMFVEGEMNRAWKEAALSLEKDRLAKFREQMGNEFFTPASDFNPDSQCRICGSRVSTRPVQRAGQTENMCNSCEELENIGRRLGNAKALLTVWGGEGLQKARKIFGEPDADFPALAAAFFLVNDTEKLPILGTVDGECGFINLPDDTDISLLPVPGCALSMLRLGKWDSKKQRKETGRPWEFDDYAEQAEGIKRMGILRMDVDNLGTVFVNGLQFPVRSNEGWGGVEKDRVKPMASLSRMATLSRQLDLFFSGHVSSLLETEKFDRCQVIYAGGDDLFIIGSWDQLPDLAHEIKQKFSEFCCHNPDMTISGGLVLQRGRYPVYKGAALAGQAEKEAKGWRRRWSGAQSYEKAGFSFLGVTILWETMPKAKEMMANFVKEMESNRGLTSFLARMTATNKNLVAQRVVGREMSVAEAWRDIAYESWQWRTAYQLRRRYKDETQRLKWAEQLLKVNEEDNQPPLYTWLELPLRWAEFIQKNKEEHNGMQIPG